MHIKIFSGGNVNTGGNIYLPFFSVDFTHKKKRRAKQCSLF